MLTGATILALALGAAPAPSAQLEGEVRDQAAPIEGARVELVGTRYSTVTGHDGHFSLGIVAAGDYTLRVMRIGYRPLLVPHVIVGEQSDTPPLVLTLERAPVPLAAVVVTPGYFGIMQPSIATTNTLTRQDIETVPQIGEDIYRAITRIPGVSADDYSARFSVRGATGDALYVTLDGLALTEPFHLKDIGGSLSIIDIQALGGAELTTGGPGVEYGEQLAGVFAMHSLEPRTDRTRTSLGLSIMNARVMSEGGFANGRGGWLVSARRGYIDIALKIVSASDSLEPRYYDVFGKVQYDFGRAGKVALHGLIAGDKLRYQDGPNDSFDNKYGSAYAWATWNSDDRRRLTQQTVASVGRLDWLRKGGSIGASNVDDSRVMRLVNLRQDWTLSMTPRAMLKAGFDGGHQSADYDFASWVRHRVLDANNQAQTRYDSVAVVLSPAGDRLGAYVAQRLRVTDAVTVEGGVRYDNGQQRGGPQIGPRLNAAWEPRTGNGDPRRMGAVLAGASVVRDAGRRWRARLSSSRARRATGDRVGAGVAEADVGAHRGRTIAISRTRVRGMSTSADRSTSSPSSSGIGSSSRRRPLARAASNSFSDARARGTSIGPRATCSHRPRWKSAA